MESPTVRRRTMQAVKSKDTGPELFVRRLLHAQGYRYRLHGDKLPGCPDLVFAGRKKVIFVNGCFRHGHSCARGMRVPKTNRDYWTTKVARNRTRDSACRNALRREGWGAMILWECELGSGKLLSRLRRFLG